MTHVNAADRADDTPDVVQVEYRAVPALMVAGVLPLILLFLALQRLWRADLLAGALTG